MPGRGNTSDKAHAHLCHLRVCQNRRKKEAVLLLRRLPALPCRCFQPAVPCRYRARRGRRAAGFRARAPKGRRLLPARDLFRIFHIRRQYRADRGDTELSRLRAGGPRGTGSSPDESGYQ